MFFVPARFFTIVSFLAFQCLIAFWNDMSSPEVFFGNSFNDDYDIDVRLNKFVVLTLAKMQAANTNGSLTDIINNIIEKRNSFFQFIVGKKDELSEQKSFILTTDEVMEACINRARDINKIVNGVFQEQPATIVFFAWNGRIL